MPEDHRDFSLFENVIMQSDSDFRWDDILMKSEKAKTTASPTRTTFPIIS
jgi:hypothetical protein